MTHSRLPTRMPASHHSQQETDEELTRGSARKPAWRCPRCGSQESRKVSARTHSLRSFTIRALRECKDCGQVFEPPSRLALRAVTVAVGGTFAAAALMVYIVPALRSLLAGEMSVKHAVDALLGVIAMWGSIYVLQAGVRSRRPGAPRQRSCRDTGDASKRD